MKDTAKKVGYLKGLLEGMNFESDSANGKVIHCIADLLGDLCERVDSMDEVLADLNDYVESIDDDLSALEGDSDGVFDLADDEDEEDYDDFDGAADQLHLLHGAADAEKSDDDALAGCVCPHCAQVFVIESGAPEGTKYVCPHCAAAVFPVPLTPANAPKAHPVDEE